MATFLRILLAIVGAHSVVAAASMSPFEVWAQGFKKQHERFLKHPGLLLRGFRDEKAPPKGAVYCATVRMPVIGRQSFMLRVLSRSRARIVLQGRLDLDEPARYSPEQKGLKRGRVSLLIDFNEPTKRLLARWKTRIRAVLYDPSDDVTILVIQPPVIPAIHVRMKRVQCQ